MARWLIIPFIAICLQGFAQERCATLQIPSNNNRSESKETFEHWLHKRLTEKSYYRPKQQVYEVPVVFHVIHDGSAIGSGSNISTEKILEQVEIINEDFRRTNEDASQTPDNFLPVAVDTEIQFVLARQDPEGMPTDGIVRIQGSKPQYSPSEEAVLMSESFWPHEDYMNIYITDLTGDNLGFAQFPFSNLPGIASELENYENTDGVVLDYNWVGVNLATGSFDSYGRTATHEIGHFLGLRHIWGDGGCGVDDFCNDTPEASGSTNGCPASKQTCGTIDMFQNYMDYTDDECMNLFTACQKSRMRTVLEQSPRRLSLLSSPGLEEPVLVANDLGVRSIIAPSQVSCMDNLVPAVEVRNYGTNSISSFTILMRENGSVSEAKEVVSPLNSGETTTVSFEPMTLNPQLENRIEFEIASVNGGSDGNLSNNLGQAILSPFNQEIIPWFEDFETNQAFFTRTEYEGTSMWGYTTAPDSIASNQAAYLPFHNQTANFGVQDMLITRTLDLSGLTSAQLDFRYAYANTPETKLDGLIIAVSTNCGAEFKRSDYVFERYGASLSTAGTSSNSFIPTGESDWDLVSLNITEFAGEEEVQIAFIGVNGGGNNLYLDNPSVTSANLLAFDIGIRNVKNLPVVTCEESAFPTIEFKNFGYEDVTEITFQVNVNGSSSEITYSDVFIPSGGTAEYLINTSNEMTPGENQFTFTVSQVNGRIDEQSSNNELSFLSLVEESEDDLPVKETFESSAWITISPSDELLFEITDLNGSKVLSTNNFGNPVTSKSYLVSPTINTLDYNEAAIRFDYSYAQRSGFNDNLKVLLSFNCGRTFDKEILSLNAEQLAITTSNTEWMPENEEDWRSAFIDISEYLIWPQIRVAFVFSNGNGNRLYIDNIDVLTTADPFLPEFADAVKLYPNPADGEFNVAFNLPDKETVRIRLVDISGHTLFDEEYDNILNQTLNFKTPAQSGYYFLYTNSSRGMDVERLFIR